VGVVKEIAAAVKRIEGRLEYMDGRQARMESDLTDFRKETRDQFARLGRRLDHHDRKLRTTINGSTNSRVRRMNSTRAV